MKIAVFGLGYVGLANTLALAQKNEIVGIDINTEYIAKLKKKISPIHEKLMSEYLENKSQSTEFTIDAKAANNVELILIATPTNYDEENNYFDTSSIENVLDTIDDFENKLVIIKSTIPIGYTKKIREKYTTDNIIFSPEFLRESKSLDDVLSPSRIIIGDRTENGEKIARIFREISLNDPEVLLMNPTEAEAVKLFANTYLANRVAFFNELDTYALSQNLNSADIIRGISLDPRIGNFYNNPSFGYGGYCLPKDTKQLLANFDEVSQDLISAIVKSNDTRKNFIAQEIVSQKPKIVGVYRLTMKSGSDNFRSSAIFDIIHKIIEAGIEVIIFEPTIRSENYEGLHIESNFSRFAKKSDIIIANRFSNELEGFRKKVFSRDVFHDN